VVGNVHKAAPNIAPKGQQSAPKAKRPLRG